MNKVKVEYAIIGSGTAGLGAYSRIRRKTDNFIMIQHGPYGTTCARVGCMPSKMLITAADHAHEITEGGFFGVNGSYQVDGVHVFERLRRDRAQKFVGGVLKQINDIPVEFKLKGFAKFAGPNTVVVDNSLTIEADKIIVACGSRPNVPDVFKKIQKRLYTSDSIFEIENLPESLGVIGLGVIALELGQSFHRLGVKTTFFGRSGRTGDLTHPDMQGATLDVLSKELDIIPQGEVLDAWEDDECAWVKYRLASGDTIVRNFAAILVAVGRVSNIDKLNIQSTGVELDSKGFPYFDAQTMQCGESPIYIAGDATDELPLWHEAYDEGRIAGDSALNFPEKVKGVRKVPLGIYFTDPQMAIVGKSFNQLAGVDIVIGDLPFRGPRHEVWNKTQGRIQVYLEARSGVILGAELLGYQAEHLAHLLALAITHKMTADQVLEMPIYHPSAEEVLRNVLNQARFKLT
ncbi:MAG: dihydrolipoyl dehydrogenase [Pseudomonas sp.]|nr:dihydrolipoyl dehydrogenase [Pseudomonas sp.]